MEKQALIEEFELSLLSKYEPSEIRELSDVLLNIVSKYDIQKKEMGLINYDTSNDDILTRYIGCMMVAGRAQRSIKYYVGEVRKLTKFCGKKIEDVTTMDVRMFLAEMIKRNVKKSTLLNSKNYISSFYKWCKKEGIVNDNPCDYLDKIKIQKTIEPPFSEIEIDKMRTTKLSIRERAIFELFLSSGLRVSELCNLNKNDIDLQTLKIHVVDGKGGKDRYTFMNRVAAYHVKEYLETRTDKNIALFLNFENRADEYKTRLGDSGVRVILNKVADWAEVDNVHPHRFRHTFATTMYNRGMDLHEIQKLLGHENIDTTIGYISSGDSSLENSFLKHMI